MLQKIVIHTTPAQIAVRTTPGSINIHSNTISMTIDNNLAQPFSMKIEQPKINIDQTDSFADVGLKKPIPMAMDFYKSSLQKGMESIATIARESAEFLQIEKGGNPIASQGKQAGVKNHTYGAKAMPAHGPEISVEQGTVETHAGQNTMKINWQPVKNQNDYTPADVSVQMVHRGDIEISLEPGVELHFPVSNGIGGGIDAST